MEMISDVYLNSQQLIRKYKYTCEEHLVQTEDGFILKVFRIPREGPPVLLVHGIGDSSDSWLVLGPKESLGFLLADLGFDVWLFNARGNKYSKGHVKTISNKEYWRFSFEEMGSRDLPSTIDHILSVTQQNTLTYVGFSQGTTIFLIMCSLKPEYNEKINHSVLIAPVAWAHNMKHSLVDTVAKNLHIWTYIVDQLGVYEIFSSNPIRNRYHAELCNQHNLHKYLCELEYYLSYGLKNASFIAPDKFPVVASHIPAGASSFTFLHYVQNYLTRRFQRLDYGIESYWKSDMSIRELPEYNVSMVRVPVTLFSSATDWLSDKEDVNRLRRTLNNVVNYNFINESINLSHIEFMYGSRAKTLINEPLISMLLSLFNMKR